MKLKKFDEVQLVNSIRNMKIKNKKRSHILRNVQGSTRIVNHSQNDKIEQTRLIKSRRPFNLNLSRKRRSSANYVVDNCSPTRAYHSDSETVVRKDKDTSYRSQNNLTFNNDDNCTISFINPPPSVDEQSDYLSSNSFCPVFQNESHHVSTGIYYKTDNSDIEIKRLSLRESSASLFTSNSFETSRLGNFDRSPSLQNILCSSNGASPSFRTPMSTISGGNCDQLTAASTSSRVSCSSGFSHSGVFNNEYSCDDFNALDSYQIITNNESTVTRRDSSTWISNISKIRNCSSFQQHSLSSDVDLSRKQTENQISCDNNNTNTDDLSSYMDLMIHIPKMHL